MGSRKCGREFRLCWRWRRCCCSTRHSFGTWDLPGAWGEGWGINGGCGCQESQTPIPAWQDTRNSEFHLLLHGFLCYPSQGLRGVHGLLLEFLCVGIPIRVVSWSFMCSVSPRPNGLTWQEKSWNLPSIGFIYPFLGFAVVSLCLEGSLPCKKSQKKGVFPQWNPFLVQLMQREASLGLSSVWHRDYSD